MTVVMVILVTIKVVGLTLTSFLWKQITQTRSYLLKNNCHDLAKLMLSFQKIVDRGDNFHTSGGKSSCLI